MLWGFVADPLQNETCESSSVVFRNGEMYGLATMLLSVHILCIKRDRKQSDSSRFERPSSRARTA